MSILLIILTTILTIVAGAGFGILLAVSKIDKMYQELEDLTHLDDEDEGE